MKNKILIIGICVCVVILSLATACGSSGGATTSAANPTNTTSPVQTTTPSGGSGDSVADILGRGSDIASVTYDMTINTMGQEITAKIWQKGKKIKEEMTMQGQTIMVFMDTDAGTMYMYFPDQNMAMKQKLDPSQIPQGSTEENEAILQYNPTIIGTETIDGKSCTIITWDVPNTGTMKEWVWTETGFPLKMEVTAQGVTSTIEMKNIDFSDIPDSTFVLPEGVTITDM